VSLFFREFRQLYGTERKDKDILPGGGGSTGEGLTSNTVKTYPHKNAELHFTKQTLWAKM